MRPLRFFRLQLALACFLSAAPGAKAADIAVTLPPLAGLVRMLAPNADVQCLLPPHADPHHFELTPRQAERWRQAKLLVRSLPDDGGWSFLGRSADVPSISLWRQERHGWLNPKRIKPAIELLAARLAMLFPDQSARISQRLDEATAIVDRIAREWERTLAPLKTQGVILQHPSWQELMRQSGVPIRLVLESDTHGSRHGPHVLDAAIATLRQHPTTVLIGDARHELRTLRWLARQVEPSARLVELDPIGNCNEDWSELMRRNMQRLRPKQP